MPTKDKMSAQCTPLLNAKEAIAIHVRWRIALQMAIATREPLSASAVSAIDHPDDCCIGRWLLSSHTFAIRRRPEYLALVARHIEFHREMAHIARLIHTSDFDTATAALGPAGSFQRASRAIANAITAVDRIQTITLAG
jgi:methyl-accepting chemotaxis protein